MRPGSGSGHLAAWIPTGLLDLDPGSSLPISNAEGLTAVQLRWDRGQLLAPIPLDPPNVSPEALVLPRLVDAHVHLDKAFLSKMIRMVLSRMSQNQSFASLPRNVFPN